MLACHAPTLPFTLGRRRSSLLRAVLVCAAVLSVCAPARAQTAPDVSFPVTVRTDAGASQALMLGLDPGATGGVDGPLGEVEQPPLPPSTVFDARLLVSADGRDKGLLRDYRPGAASATGTRQHEIQIQAGEGATEVTLHWGLPAGVTGTLADKATGGEVVSVPMSGSGAYTLPTLSLDRLSVTLDYSGEQRPVTVRAQRVTGAGRFDFPETGTQVGFAGVEAAGTVVVKKFPNGPSGTDGIAEANVSTDRFEIDTGALVFTDPTLQVRMSAVAGADDPAAVQVYRRSPPGSGTFQAVPTTPGEEGAAVEAMPNAFGELVLASNSEPLPVTLTSVTAVRTERGADIRWRTAREVENAGFRVQHQPPGAQRWNRLGFVQSRAPGGTVSEPRRYRFAVPVALGHGTHRFRLQQVDLDGTSHATKPVRLVVQPQAAVTLSAPAPNPASGPVRISFSVREAEQAALHLYNALGKRVATLYRGGAPARGCQTVRLNAAALPSGLYFLRLTTDGRTRTRTLTVVR